MATKSSTPLKIIYAGRRSQLRKSLLNGGSNVIVLLYNNWDDYGYKTTCPTECIINNEYVELGSIQVLLENVEDTHEHLAKLISDGWDGSLPIPSTNYVSTPAHLSFYEQIAARLGMNAATDAAKLLRDASLLARIVEDEQAFPLVQSPGFERSLQREQGATRAFLDGWKLFSNREISIENQRFHFESASGGELTLDLRFSATRPMPYDINVVIGPNGVGKSQLLQHIVKDWLHLGEEDIGSLGFKDRPNFSQLVAVSYSPFEQFPVDTSGSPKRKDIGSYRYFGLRGRRNRLKHRASTSGNITLSWDFPRYDAAHSLLDCLSHDRRYGAIKDWSRKVFTMEKVLRQAIDFDYAAIVVSGVTDNRTLFTDLPQWIDDPFISIESDNNEGPGTVWSIPIASDRLESLNVEEIRKMISAKHGVIFLKDGEPIFLSSGQKLFSYIVINILGAIRRNSLIIVDEPELFLHPTLEISFLKMLKSILTAYASKALLATHSLVAVREMPSDCVHVFERTKDGIVIKTPPFETFGGDIQRISSYVFGDKSVSKPYEDWVRLKLNEFGSADAFLDALGEDVNEEMMIQINAMGSGKW